MIQRMKTGGAILGAYLALVCCAALIGLTVRRRRDDYVADRGACYACGRCFRSCPREHLRLGLIQPPVEEGYGKSP